MNVLFVTIAWPVKGVNNLYSDLLEEFKLMGHCVYVLHGAGNQISNTAISDESGIKILRVRTGQITKTNPVRKFISLISLGFRLSKAYKHYYNDLKIDLILFATPPVTLSYFLKELKEVNKAKLYLLLKDIWPYGFSDLGVIRRNGLIWKFFKLHENNIYKISDFIGCMSPKGVDFLLANNPTLNSSKVEVCPNAIRLPPEPPSKIRDIEIRNKYNIPLDATVFIFSGNIGRGHGIEFLAKNIITLSDYKKAFFLIGGAGTSFAKIKNELESAGITNSLIYSYLPKKDFEHLLRTCNVGIILLSKCYSYPQFPSRLQSYLKNGMAVLCAVNDATDIGEIVVANNCGLSGKHGDNDTFQNNVRYLSEHPQILNEMSENSWRLLQKEYDVAVAYNKIIRHF